MVCSVFCNSVQSSINFKLNLLFKIVTYKRVQKEELKVIKNLELKF